MLGVGAPTALQFKFASFPSKIVTFCGAISMTGVEAEIDDSCK